MRTILRLPFCTFAITWPACKNISYYFTFYIQNTMAEKEELAINKMAFIIFPWQVERVLHIKFPGEISRAEEAGFVRDILFVGIASNTVYVRIRANACTY